MNTMLGDVKRKFIWVLAVAATLSLQSAMAQDTAGEAVTDEELTQYATVMNKIDSMKEDLQDRYNEVIKSNELMDEGRRFVAIKGAWGNEAKMAELNVTEEEKAAYEGILVAYDKMVADFKEAYPAIIKDELGAALYNKVSQQLKKDKELEAKYNELLISMKKDDETDQSDSGE